MNRLLLARRTQVIHCLVEGNSIRSTEGMTDTDRDNHLPLAGRRREGCATLASEQMRNLNCRRIRCDEIWSFCRVKQAHVPHGVRLHKTLRVTPAMAAGVSDRLWSLEELVDRMSK